LGRVGPVRRASGLTDPVPGWSGPDPLPGSPAGSKPLPSSFWARWTHFRVPERVPVAIPGPDEHGFATTCKIDAEKSHRRPHRASSPLL
jgi:hypothetical protein